MTISVGKSNRPKAEAPADREQYETRSMSSVSSHAELSGRAVSTNVYFNQGINQLESTLPQLSSLRLEPQVNHLESASAQHPHHDSLMLSLVPMRSSLCSAVSQLHSAVPAKVSEEAVKFLLDEFGRWVAFGHDALAFRNRESLEISDGDNGRLPGLKTRTSALRNYSLDDDIFLTNNVTPRKH